MHITQDLPSSSDFSVIPTLLPVERIEEFTSQGWTYRPTSILATYKESWNEWFSVREFVQNSLDETNGFEIAYDTDQNISYIIDDGEGIDIKDMFLGQQKGASEEEIHCLRGVFGEGMKLALIPLLNDNKPVIVRTVGIDYLFTYIQETSARKGEFKYIGIFTMPNRITKGTVIAIKNTDCTKYLKFFAPTIAATDPDKILLTVKGGYETEWDECKTRQVFDIPGMIFVRDIFVQYLDSFFGYNFWFDSTRDALGSDRVLLKSIYVTKREFFLLTEASATKYPEFINDLIKKFWTGRGETIEGKKFLAQESLEWQILDRVRPQELSKRVAQAIYMAIFASIGQDFSWSENPVEQKALEHAGIKDLRDQLPNMSQLLGAHGLIRLPKDIVKAAELTDKTVIFSPKDILTFPELDSDTKNFLAEQFEVVIKQLNALLKLVRKYYEACKNTQIYFYVGEYEKEERVAGFYAPKSDEIFIRMKNIFEFEDLMRVFIHETAHAYCHTTVDYTGYDHSDCSDLSQGFEDSMERVSTIFLMDAVKDYSVDYDELGRAVENLWREKDDLELIIQTKLQEVNNPYGLVRPKHQSEKDKRAIDETLSRIAKGCYFGPTDVRAILEGYNPFGHTYDPSDRPRASRKSAVDIAQADKKLLEKLDIQIPTSFKEITKNNLRDWALWVEGRVIDAEKVLFSGEDHEDFEACLYMIENHPDPRTKKRNLEAAFQLINPREAYEELRQRDSREARIAQFEEGRFIDLPKLERLLYTVLPLMDADKEVYDCLDHWGEWGWASLKERIIEIAGMKVPADTIGWYRVLDKGENSRHPDNRRYTAKAFKDIAPRNIDYSLTALVDMLKRENHPQVLDSILHHIHEILVDMRYPGRSQNAREGFETYAQIVMDNYDHILEIAAIDDDLNYYREPLRKRLQRIERHIPKGY